MGRRLLLVTLGMLGLTALSIYAYLQNPPDPSYVLPQFRQGTSMAEIVVAMALAWSFAGAGLALWYRHPENHTGLLLVGAGAAELAASFQFLPVPALVSLGRWLGGSWGLGLVLLGVVVLAYPTGRIVSRLDRWWIALAGVFLGMGLVQTLVTPGPLGARCEERCRSLIVLSYDEHLRIFVDRVVSIAYLALFLFLIALIVRRWMTASRPARRTVTPMLAAGLVIVVVVVSDVAFWTFRDEVAVYGGIGWTSGRDWILAITPALSTYLPIVGPLSLALVPIALLWGVLRSQFDQAAVSALAIELHRPGRRPLVDALRDALGDRSLELALWSRPVGSYVTPAGLPVPLPAEGDGRAVTLLDAEDGPLAALVHDPLLAEQRRLVEGVAAVAQLAIENERLHAEVKAQLEEVRASRQRIVQAADEERRRVERNIHDGAQQRLVSLSLALGMAHARATEASPEVAATLEQAEAELQRAIGDLRELARGIHPAILTEAGLGPALESLADHSPIPVTVRTDLDGRLPPLLEATAYFVAAEALTNIAKHATAGRATLSAEVGGGWLRVTVVDDGAGGADPTRGSGLRGLMDRVSALGGRLAVEEEPAGGTRLHAEIPCA